MQDQHQKKRLSVLWHKHLKSENDRSDFEQTIRNSRTALTRLSDIIDNLITEIETKENNFDDPNWANRQAHIVGQKLAFKKIKQLIDIY